MLTDQLRAAKLDIIEMSINHQKSVTAEAVALSQLSGCQTQLDQLRTELERRQDQWARIEQLKDRERQSQVSIDVLRKAEAAANAECDALSSLRTAAQERHDAEMAAVREKLEALADQPSQQVGHVTMNKDCSLTSTISIVAAVFT